MKRYIVCSLLVLASCSSQSKFSGLQQKAVLNKQSQQQLISQLKQQGIYESIQTSTIDRNFQVVTATSGENYFIKDNAVVSSSRPVKAGPERTLLYWRYKFKGKTYREARVEGPVDEHTDGLRQLACDSQGMGVVYDSASEQVTRVFYYEAK